MSKRSWCPFLVSVGLSIFYFTPTPWQAKVWAQERPVVGDRLIVSINSTPYSQRQLECYLLVKESLRDGSNGPVPVLTAAYWPAALAAFAEDMIVHQEAHRVGSYQASDAALKIAREKFEKRRELDAGTNASARRLGIEERTLLRTLHTVLRTEAFRRNKDRQSVVARVDDEGAPKWFEDIRNRAVVRFYSGAESYIEINPSTEK